MKWPGVVLVSLPFLIAPFAAEAQQVGRLPRSGVLVVWAWPNHPEVEAFRQSLREPGYVEGLNVLLDFRSSEGRVERWPDLVADLLRLPVDVIVVPTTGAALAAKQATKTIPIVASTEGALLEAGVIASLARPGGKEASTGASLDPSLAEAETCPIKCPFSALPSQVLANRLT